MRDFIYGINMLSNMRLCSNVPAQSIVQTALGGHQSVTSYVVPGGRVYEQRNYVYEALNAIDGVSAVKPRAAFYIFPKLDVKKFNITDDEQFALDLLHEKHILITRGGGFNWDEAGSLPHRLPAAHGGPARGDGGPRGLPGALSPAVAGHREEGLYRDGRLRGRPPVFICR